MTADGEVASFVIPAAGVSASDFMLDEYRLVTSSVDDLGSWIFQNKTLFVP